MNKYGEFSTKRIVKFTGNSVRELEDFPISEAGKFKYIPNEDKVLQFQIEENQYLCPGNYLLRDTDDGKYVVLIEKSPISRLLEEYAGKDFPKDFQFRITELL